MTYSCTRIVSYLFKSSFLFFLTYLKSSLFYLLMRVCKNTFLLKKKIHIKELMCSVLISNLRRSKGWICTHAYYVFIQSYVHVDVLVTKIHLVPMSNFFIFLNHAAIILLLPIFECTHRVLLICTCLTLHVHLCFVFVVHLYKKQIKFDILFGKKRKTSGEWRSVSQNEIKC